MGQTRRLTRRITQHITRQISGPITGWVKSNTRRGMMLFAPMMATVVVTAVIMTMVIMTAAAQAQDFTALARVDTADTHIQTSETEMTLTLGLSQSVPYRVFSLDAPRRIILDFQEVDWSGFDGDAILPDRHIGAIRVGQFRPGWSRMVLDLTTPMVLDLTDLETDAAGKVALKLGFVKTDAADFTDRSGAPLGADWDLPEIAVIDTPITRQTGDRPIVVVLDPGHGGIDPGAENGGVREADLMLMVARSLKESLIRAQGFEVVLTRTEDVFVPLETRISIARAARADVFISLHADALPEGHASGARVFTLSEGASDIASQKLAERHDRGDLLAGVDLRHHDDLVANVLMDMARRETAPRSDALADHLVQNLQDKLDNLYKKPRAAAGFSVLKAPDIPSVLIELGFLSNPKDLARLEDPEWRARAVEGMTAALRNWAITDAAEAQLLRQ